MQRFLRLAGFLRQAAGTAEEQAKNYRWGLHKSIPPMSCVYRFTMLARFGCCSQLRDLRDRRIYDRSEHRTRGIRDEDQNPPATQAWSSGAGHRPRNRGHNSTLPNLIPTAGQSHAGLQEDHLGAESGHANKKPDASDRVFALTQDQAANTSGTITGTLFTLFVHIVLI
ncbi:hypothetical protein Tco_0196159 [Tanacetum coccineum]